MQILRSNKMESSKITRIKKLVVLGASAIAIIITYSESALAAFDLAKGVKAGTDPLVALITEYYGVGIALGACAGALVGQGDLRDRGINAGKGAAIAGGVILALLKAAT